MTSRDFQGRLSRRARRAGAPLPDRLGERLEIYFRLLSTWNTKINLTGLDLSDPSPETIDRLLIEPLIAAMHVSASTRRVMDVGSGGGSPAIPLALAIPGIDLLLVESKIRKSVFLREAIRALELEAGVVTARFEELLARPDLHEAHDLLTIRAVRVEPRVLMSLQAFVRPGGHIMLFRGTDGGETLGSTLPQLELRNTYPLTESTRSQLVVLEKHATGH